MLHRLCKADEIRYWKFTRGKTGQLFVLPEEARSALDEAREKQARMSCRPETQKPVDLQCESVRESLGDIAFELGVVVKLLERIATAAESVATAPPAEITELTAYPR
jgi:hypothetical protein